MNVRSERIDAFRVSAFGVPTDTPESDGTLKWNKTTLILVELGCGDLWSLGYTYGHACIARLAEDLIQRCVLGQSLHDISRTWGELVRQVRNDGSLGLSAMAVSAIDISMWDLKAKFWGAPLHRLLGKTRDRVPTYASGGFTSDSTEQLASQFLGWKDQGFQKFKMKVGRHPRADIDRVKLARECIGDSAALFVDANGAYDRSLALTQALAYADVGVEWFEQPIDPSDLDGMRLLRQRLPPGMSLATGEYIYDLTQTYDRARAFAEDVIQLDVTRCKGVTGYLKSAALCEAFHLPVSSHCAPSLHVALGTAIASFRHIEFFHDHARIEQLFFDGAARPQNGELIPSEERPGLGLVFKRSDAERYRI